MATMETSLPRQFTDPLLNEVNEMVGIYHKIAIVDEDQEELCHKLLPEFKCSAPECTLVFDNLLTYEIHYASNHKFSCAQCKKHLPSAYLLDLHLSETHDSFFLAQAERKPMYRCFVESCKTTSKDADERRRHCIEVHKYPHDFKFGGHSKKPPKTKKKRNPKPADEKMETVDASESTKPDSPQNKIKIKGPFTFGHKPNKTFKIVRPKKALDMSELMDTLPPA